MNKSNCSYNKITMHGRVNRKKMVTLKFKIILKVLNIADYLDFRCYFR